MLQWREKLFYPSVLILFGVIFAGCISSRPAQAKATSDLTHQITWMNQTAAIVIEEARLGDKYLYLKCRSHSLDTDYSDVFYVRANVVTEKVKDSDLNSTFKFIDEKDWEEGVEQSSSIIHLDNQQWLVIQNELAERSEENPAELIPLLTQEYLDSENIPDDKVVILTKHENNWEEPFIFVDLKNKKVVTLTTPRNRDVRANENIFQKGMKAANQVLSNSRLRGMLTRPFSSSMRIFSWGRGTAASTINPKALLSLNKGPIPSYYEGDPMDLKKWEAQLDQIVGKAEASGTINFLIGGEEFFPRLIETIEGAKESIDFRIFIFDNDDYAVQIANLLKKKSNEGVKIRILLDGIGQIMGEGKIPDDLPEDFVSPGPMVRYLTRDSKIKLRVRPNLMFQADHVKTIIIDRKICFTGGMNIGREYRYHWHDLMMELQGPVVDVISEDFQSAYEFAGSLGDLSLLKNVITRRDQVNGPVKNPIRLLYTRINDPQILKAQLAAISNAKKYIYIHNAYFSDDTILYELIKARRRGVDVRVILPVNGNHEIMNASNIVTANVMFKNGIRVFFYPGMSHIKAAVYDGWLCAGSANFDKLSLRDNLELNVATSDPEIAQTALDILFNLDFERAVEMIEPIKASLKDYLSEILAEQL